jgi:chloramphenicol 3-O phosphotransferase
MATTGVNLVVDEVVLDTDFANDWVALAGGLDVFAVGVHCDLSELERREQARGDRRIGQARGQIDLVHGLLAYDLEVDTTAAAPDMTAAAIAAAWAARSRPCRLRRR